MPQTLIFSSAVSAERFNQTAALFRSGATLIATWSMGTAEGTSDFRIVASKSTDDGATWSTPSIAFQAESPWPAYNGALFKHGDRVCVLATTGVGTDATRDVVRIESDDLGETWHSPKKIPFPVAHSYMPMCTPIESTGTTTAGKLLFPFYHRTTGVASPRVSVAVVNSDFSQMESRGNLSITAFWAALEPSLVVDGDTWNLYIRNDLHVIYRFTSTNEGVTWGAAEALSIPAPATWQHIQSANGRILLTGNLHPQRRDRLAHVTFDSADTDLSDPVAVEVIARSDFQTEWVTYPRVIWSKPYGYETIFARVNPATPTGKIYYDRRTTLAAAPKVRTESFARKSVPITFPAVVTARFPLLGVSFANATHGIAFGDWGVVLHTNDGGATWVETARPSDAALLGGALDTNGVSALVVGKDDNYAYIADVRVGGWANTSAAGVNGTCVIKLATGKFLVGTSDNRILETTDNGANFTVRATLAKPIRGLCVSTGYAWAVGDDGLVARAALPGATSWNAVTVGSPATTGDFVSCAAKGISVVLGAERGEAWRSLDDGTTWAQISNIGADRLAGVSFGRHGSVLMASEDGSVYETLDPALLKWGRVVVDVLGPLHGVAHAGDTAIVTGWGGRLWTRS